MKKLCIAVLAMLVASCSAIQIYQENIISMGTSKAVMVEEYENIALNMRKVHDGIQILCSSKQTRECEDIKFTYNQTRDAFIKVGNLAIEYINAEDNKVKIEIYMRYLQAVKEFEVLWSLLIKKASELGIGGIK